MGINANGLTASSFVLLQSNVFDMSPTGPAPSSLTIDQLVRDANGNAPTVYENQHRHCPLQSTISHLSHRKICAVQGHH